jgi:tetratricopeptide (TPR) repeat protein
MRLLCILIPTLWLAACVPTTARMDISPAQHRQTARELIAANNLQGAAKEMLQALKAEPNITDALLYADLLEALKDYKGARKTYKKSFRYPAEAAQKQELNYRLALLEATDFDNLKSAEKRVETLPADDSRRLDLQSFLLFKRGEYKQALAESQRALAGARNNEEKAWAYYHMAQIYYELRIEGDTFSSLFQAVNNGRGYSLVARITEYWEERRHQPFPKD